MAANAFRPYLTKLQKARKDFPEVMAAAVKKATIRAVEVTTEATPPKDGTGRGPYIGPNTINSKLKQSWASDSVVEPTRVELSGGQIFHTALKSDLQYASHVNDGHWMNRHFVPGLYIDAESGLLSYDPDKDVGIVVGTKTPYVKGEFMVDKGVKAFIETLENELGVRVKELFEK